MDELHSKKEPLPMPRALFIYDTDREIDEAHPLWKDIMLYSKKVEELHVLVFIKKKLIEDKVTQIGANIFVYYVSARFVFPHLERLWYVVKGNLIWKKKFRADIVLNFSTHLGSLVGVYLSKRYKKKFFLATSGSFLELPTFSREYLLLRLLARAATMIYVHGEKIADILVARTRISNERVAVIRPAIDLEFLNRPYNFVEYNKKYPQHNLFLIAHTSMAHQRGLAVLFDVFQRLITKYPRTALVIITPPGQMKHVQQIVHKHGHRRGVYVYHETSDPAELYGGGHILLSTSEAEEINMPVVTALGLHVPVITTPAGIAKEIFTNSRFAEFMCPFGDVDAFVTMATRLIESQNLRDDYRMNSPLLLKSLTLQTKEGYVDMLFSSMTETIEIEQ